jgi:hypothetical protein
VLTTADVMIKAANLCMAFFPTGTGARTRNARSASRLRCNRRGGAGGLYGGPSARLAETREALLAAVAKAGGWIDEIRLGRSGSFGARLAGAGRPRQRRQHGPAWPVGSGQHALARSHRDTAEVMGVVGVLALLVNGGVAFVLYRYRGAFWICSRNDTLGNVAVMLAALGVFGTGTGWPDIIVASIMAVLSLWGAGQIINHAWNELRTGEGRVLSSAPAE